MIHTLKSHVDCFGILWVLAFFACSQPEVPTIGSPDEAHLSLINEKVAQRIKEVPEFIRDNVNRSDRSYIILYSEDRIDTIRARFACKTDRESNSISIQSRSRFLAESKREKYSYLNFPFVGQLNQETYLTFTISDDKVDDAKITRRSQEPAFDNAYILEKEISTYQVRINTNNPGNIRGQIQARLPVNYGIHKKDYFVIMNFSCKSPFYFKEFKPDTRKFPKGKNRIIDSTFKADKYINNDNYSNFTRGHMPECLVLHEKDKIVINLHHGDGYSGSNLKIVLKEEEPPSFWYSEYSCIPPWDPPYRFPNYELVMNLDPFQDEITGLEGKFFIATDSLSQFYGQRKIKRAVFGNYRQK